MELILDAVLHMVAIFLIPAVAFVTLGFIGILLKDDE